MQTLAQSLTLPRPAACCRDGGAEPVVGMERLEVGAEAVVDVAPLGGRLVLFLAGAVEHAVLPCQAERVALTAWCQ